MLLDEKRFADFESFFARDRLVMLDGFNYS